MAGYNRVILVGNLTRDPDYKQLSSGQSVCRLGLATNRQFKNRQTGNMVQEVCFVDIDVWGAQAESCRQYLQKGRAVLVEGRLKFDTWEDQNGQTRSKHSIVADRVVFLSSSSNDFDSATRSSSDKQATSGDPEVDRALMKQLENVQANAKKKEKQKQNESTGEIDFKDTPPFDDELPF